MHENRRDSAIRKAGGQKKGLHLARREPMCALERADICRVEEAGATY